MARNLERGNNSARRNLRDIMDNGEVPGVNPEDPLHNTILQERREAASLEETPEERPVQEGEETPDRIVRERLEDLSSQARDGSQNQPAAKKTKQGVTPKNRPKRTVGRRGH